MSLFPSVGSTVTKVLTNKSGTTARVEFDDGTSLLVKYEALVIDQGSSGVVETSAPVTIRKESRVVQTRSVPARRPMTMQRPAMSKIQLENQKLKTDVQDDAKFKMLAAQAMEKSKSRSERLFEQWEKDSGQHDVPAGPTTLNS